MKSLVPATLAFVILAAPAMAQVDRAIPAGNPLGDSGVTDLETARAQARQAQLATARARANRQAMAEAFAPSAPAPAAEADEGRPRAPAASFGQPPDTPARPAPSPYGGYYQIRTPWDRR